MIQSIQRGTIVEMLLNTLEAERYVRGPLLLNVVDELTGVDSLAPAAEMARGMLASLEAGRLSDDDFHKQLAQLRSCVHRLSRPRLSEPPAEALARTSPRLRSGRATAA